MRTQDASFAHLALRLALQHALSRPLGHVVREERQSMPRTISCFCEHTQAGMRLAVGSASTWGGRAHNATLANTNVDQLYGFAFNLETGAAQGLVQACGVG